jgi:hypothetical protein
MMIKRSNSQLLREGLWEALGGQIAVGERKKFF